VISNQLSFNLSYLLFIQSENAAELETALDLALEAGYRHFDTAFAYQNEETFGKVLKRWFDAGKVKREDLFIVTKVNSLLVKEGLMRWA